MEPADQPGEFFAGRTTDISEAGLLGRFRAPVDSCKQVEVLLPPAAGFQGARVKGECVRILQDPEDEAMFYMGIRFDLASGSDEQLIQNLITHYGQR